MPPLSFPRCGPPWSSRVGRPSMLHRIRPSGGGLQSPSQHPKADTGESGPPRGLVWIVASSQPSTDPEKRRLLARGPTGLRSPPASQPRRPLGGQPHRQEARFTSTAVGELTRVNIACRAHGTTRAEKRPPQDTPPSPRRGGDQGLRSGEVPGRYQRLEKERPRRYCRRPPALHHCRL